MAKRGFLSIFRFLAPSWLTTGEYELVLESLASLKDAFMQRMLDSLEARFPSRAGPSALALIGADRAIMRGSTETDVAYSARLPGFRQLGAHLTRGNAFAILTQVAALLGEIKVSLVDGRGTLSVLDVDGTFTVTRGVAWDWDGAVDPWRFWLILEPNPERPDIVPHPLIGAPSLYGGALGTPGYTIGQQGVTAEDVRRLRALFVGRTPWHPSGTTPVMAIIRLSGDPYPAPDGTWDTWSGRDPELRYWNLTT
jgi:hypothetical protein